jgi:hypothetical protein
MLSYVADPGPTESCLGSLEGRNCAGSYEEGVAPLTRGCSAQSWDANSSESCAWKFRVIWSSVLPMGGPDGLNTQAHSEQPHPITLCSLIHTVLRDELSWPEVGTQHLTSGQWKVRHATLPNRTKAGPASIHDFFTRDSLAERVGTQARSYKPGANPSTVRPYGHLKLIGAGLVLALVGFPRAK